MSVLSRLFHIASLIVIATLLNACVGNTQPTFSPYGLKMKPPNVTAKQYLILDYDTGEILFHAKGFEKIEPASITKVMTSYIVFQLLRQRKIKLTDKVRVSRRARHMIGSRSFLEAGSLVTVEALIKGMLVQSGNDAAIALAEHISGSEKNFVTLMNTTAAKLRMKGTRFANVTGMPHSRHYTTAYDLAVLARQMIKEFPRHYQYFSMTSFTHNNITQRNRNLLLFSDDSVDGLKTGYTQRAGYCLLASAKRKGRRVISVVLNDQSEKARAKSSKKLLNFAFRMIKHQQSKQEYIGFSEENDP